MAVAVVVVRTARRVTWWEISGEWIDPCARTDQVLKAV